MNLSLDKSPAIEIARRNRIVAWCDGAGCCSGAAAAVVLMFMGLDPVTTLIVCTMYAVAMSVALSRRFAKP